MQKDIRTTDDQSRPLLQLPYGMQVRALSTHIDDRGSVFEMYDLRWDFHPDPLVFAYQFTIRPGVIKGWGLHKHHEDRYCLLYGEMEVVLYDVRPDSPTFQQVSKLYVSEYNRCLFNIPTDVWHAVRNIGTKDLIAVNFPTTPYNHADPDKYRLPLDTDEIPYKFENPRGW
jgi:dTDP-4-dehydrorhamnose 3,5-epimerase